VGSLEELVKIMEASGRNVSNEYDLAWCQELSEKIIDLLACEDEASKRAGARIMIVLMSHGQYFTF
jgi:hypothetical protein